MLRRSTLAVMLTAALFAACGKSPARAAVKLERDRKAAPEFSLKDAQGRTVKLSDYRGKVVVLNFWATWCGPCKIEIPWFVSFQQAYNNRNFTVLGVSMDDDGWTSVKPYLATSKINYPVVIGTEEISQLYGGVDSIPTTFIIDQEGRIASVHVGLVSKSEYQNEILNLLDKDAPKNSVRAAVDESRR